MPETTVMQAKRLGVFTCLPETPLVDAARRMAEEDVSALVVADAEGGLKGIITRIDLLRAHAAHADWSKYRAGDYMNPNVVTVGLDTTLFVADAVFEETKDARFAAPPLLRRMVSAGWLGRKSGRGFYDYSQK